MIGYMCEEYKGDRNKNPDIDSSDKFQRATPKTLPRTVSISYLKRVGKSLQFTVGTLHFIDV